jgi:hypothetical protein
MKDRLHFATLLLAADLGIMSRKELIAAADARIIETEQPEDWLIELSSQGECSELNQLGQREFKQVSFEVLRLAYRAWAENRKTADGFHQCCRELLHEGAALREDLVWYRDALSADDAFELAASGVLDTRAARRNVRVTMERLCQGLPCDWAESVELIELVTFTSPIYRNDAIMLSLDFPVPKREAFRDWWRGRGPAVIVRPDGHKTKAVVEFQVWLLQFKGIRDPKNFRPEDGTTLSAMLPDVTSAEAPVGSQLLVTPELWNLILG